MYVDIVISNVFNLNNFFFFFSFLSLDAGMESYIVQLDFSAAFDRVSDGDLLFKLKSIGVGGSVLSICRVPL